MAITIYPSDSRGKADYGWLKTNYSFSFANYHNPARMQFGALRVLNDDTIDPGAGFPPHEHDNMEIVTLVLEGALQHEDSMGNKGVIKANEVQTMSAGTGVVHSEFNHSKKDPVKLFQMWITPNKVNVEPSYDQKSFAHLPKNVLTPIVSGKKTDDTLFIRQDATFLLGTLEKGKTITYAVEKKDHGVFLFVIEGFVAVNGKKLAARDAAEVEGIKSFTIEPLSDARILLIDIIRKE